MAGQAETTWIHDLNWSKVTASGTGRRKQRTQRRPLSAAVITRGAAPYLHDAPQVIQQRFVSIAAPIGVEQAVGLFGALAAAGTLLAVQQPGVGWLAFSFACQRVNCDVPVQVRRGFPIQPRSQPWAPQRANSPAATNCTAAPPNQPMAPHKKPLTSKTSPGPDPLCKLSGPSTRSSQRRRRRGLCQTPLEGAWFQLVWGRRSRFAAVLCGQPGSRATRAVWARGGIAQSLPARPSPQSTARRTLPPPLTTRGGRAARSTGCTHPARPGLCWR